MIPDDRVAAALSAALDRSVVVTSRARLSGGCIGVVERLETSAGPFVLKSMPGAPAGFFAGEAAGLEALRRASTDLVVPRVVVAPDAGWDFLVIEFIAPGPREPGCDEVFGRALAALHRTSHDRYGFRCPTWCGATRQDNGWRSSWREFYRSRRLMPQIEQAASADRISGAERRDLTSLAARLDTLLIEPAEGPALIHGDLWSGNVLAAAGGRTALLDPAACHAHREFEFGMSSLFGGVADRARDAYCEAFPFEPGWRERLPLYQLYHLLNHLNLFGHGYRTAVLDIVRRYR